MNKQAILLASIGLIIVVAFMASVAEGGRNLTPTLFLSPFMSPIDGRVYDDADLNGTPGAAEQGLSGVTVQLLKDNGTVIASTSTNATGGYLFTGVDTPQDSAHVIVNEVDPPGYNSTTPNQVSILTSDTDKAHTIHFGDHGVGTIQGLVFSDLNNNGLYDGGELPLDGVTVQLLQNSAVISTSVTNASGIYEFQGLWLGQYTAQLVTPFGYVNTTATSVNFFLNTPGQTEEWDFGARPAGVIRGRVFNDSNGNGNLDSGEAGIQGVTITLRYQGGAVVSTTHTSSDGSYEFLSLWLDDYTVSETDLPNYTSTTPNQMDVNLDTPGQEAIVNFGDQAQIKVIGVVFDDLDQDGTRDSGELGISGVVIRLIDGDGGSRSAYTAVGSGQYEFTAVPMGRYTVVETDPSGFTSTTPNTVAITPTQSGETVVVNFGDFGLPGDIHGMVFDDVNGNGMLDSGESGLGNVSIALKTGSVVLSTTQTATDGSYAFLNALPLAYTVEESDPAGYSSTTPNVRSVSLPPDGNITGVDFGDRSIGTISGVVFEDLDGNGLPGSAENGLPGVMVRLLRGSSVLSTTTTNSSGSYAFSSIQAGTYTVRETDPDGYVSTTPNEVIVSLVPGSSASAHFGDQAIGSVSGVVFNDLNGNGLQEAGEGGLNGVTVQLLQGSSTIISTTTTNISGTYIFTNIPAGTYTVRETDPTGYVSTTSNDVIVILSALNSPFANFGDQQRSTISGVVFNDINANGAQGAGENGLDSVIVQLFQGSTVIATLNTNSTGHYAFSSVSAGNYTVRSARPAGFINTTPEEVVVFVAAGGSASANFGFQQVGTVSGVAFNDANGNGLYDSGESGLSGVVVSLEDSGGDTITQSVGSDGGYLFSGVQAGNYTVLASERAGYMRTTPGLVNIYVAAGSSAPANFGYQAGGSVSGVTFNDLNGNGLRDTGEPGLGGVTITLRTESGSLVAQTHSVGNGAYTFSSVEAGSYTASAADMAGFARTTPATRSLAVTSGGIASADFGYQETGSISGQVFNDLNGNGVKDSGEPGLGGVTVTLKTSGGAVITHTLSVGDGSYYLFAGMEAGNYNVAAADVAGFVRTTPASAPVALVAGGSAAVSFGYQAAGTVSGVTFRDANGNTVKDSGESGIGGIIVTLKRGDGTTFGTVLSAADGSYLFSSVTAGSYSVSAADVPGFARTTPAAVTIVIANGGGSGSANFGYQPANAISGEVFNDANGNGFRDSGETGIGGVVITLKTMAGTVVITDSSVGNGAYQLSPVAAGSYIVVAADVPGFVHTTPDSVGVSVITGGSASAHFGYQQAGSVGGDTFRDDNGDGVRNSGELGIGSVVITLRTVAGAVVMTTTSAGNGSYTFSGVQAGSYTVSAADMPGFARTTPGTLGIAMLPNGSASADFGYQQAGVISGRAFNDTNSNGVQDPGEAGLGGVTITLQNSAGATLRTSVTTNDGRYAFSNVEPGIYTVMGGDVTGFVRTTPGEVAVSLAAGSSAPANFGYQKTGSISGLVFNDLNGNGVKDDGEAGLSHVTVTLQTVAGTILMTTTSSGDGSYYLFSNLLAGSYNVVADDVPGFVRTTPGTVGISLVTGGSASASFGYQQAGTVSGVVFHDINGNGHKDDDEPGLSQVAINLRTATGAIAKTTHSAGNGLYLFSGVQAGSYTVSAANVAGFVRTTAGVVGISVATNGSASANFGYQQAGTVSGITFNDINGNAARDSGEPGIGGVVISLTTPSGSLVMTTSSTSNGNYQFTGVAHGSYVVSAAEVAGFVRTTLGSAGISLAAGGSAAVHFGYQEIGAISGLVFNDMNGNKHKDDNEPGLNGVLITLQTTGGAIVKVTSSTGSGLYSLRGVEGGSYEVSAADVTGFVHTTPNPVTVFIASGGSASADFGYQQVGSINGEVFNDANGNTVKDSNESGLGGVVVTLKTTGGTILATSTSANNGTYSFSAVEAGEYTVSAAEVPGFVRTTPGTVNIQMVANGAASAHFGYQQIGSISGSTFNDLNGNGVQNNGEAGIGGVILTLTSVSAVTTTSASDGSYVFSGMAAGTYNLAAAEVTNFIRTTPASVNLTLPANGSASVHFGYREIGIIGGMVFNDTNADGLIDMDEVGIGGVTITLNATQTDIETVQKTVGNGYYIFRQVATGDYTVKETNPLGFSSTTPDMVSIRLQVGGSASVNFGDRVGNMLYLPMIMRNYPRYHIYLPMVMFYARPPVRFPVNIGNSIATRPAAQTGEVFYSVEVQVPGALPDGGTFYLSGQRDNQADVLVDDRIVILVGTQEIFVHDFATPGVPPAAQTVQLPLSVMEQLAGRNVRVEYRDVYGNNVGASAVWMIWVP